MKDVDQFIAGFQRFQNSRMGTNSELFKDLKRAQNPRTLVIACSDSRVDPAIITDSAPGDLFIVRNVANLVPPCERDSGYHGVSAALEYAVCYLKVDNIIVMGHSQCGGINGLMEGICEADKDSFIGKWVRIAQSAKEKVLRELPEKSPELQKCACEQASILLSLENLLTYPWLVQRIEEEGLVLHGWYFDLLEGAMLGYSSNTGCFEKLA